MRGHLQPVRPNSEKGVDHDHFCRRQAESLQDDRQEDRQESGEEKAQAGKEIVQGQLIASDNREFSLRRLRLRK
jgi:hypothetical protein